MHHNYHHIRSYHGVTVGEAPSLHQGPEHRVVQVVDVAVGLAPAQVVADIALAGVEDDPAVEYGCALEVLVGEELSPAKHVARREVTHDVGEELPKFM